MEHKPVHELLADVMVEVRSVAKNDRNSAQGFDFRGIDSVINAVGPALRKHRVVVVPHAAEARYRDVKTATGKPSRECTVLVTYRFCGPAGDFLDVQVPGESMDTSDKGTAKAMSVAYRIALIQALCLPTDDRDPDHDHHERGKEEHLAEREPQIDDEAELVRTQIRNVATAKHIPLRDIMGDFEERTKQNIRDAPADVLVGYLTDLKAHGLRREAECS
jgi:hypothetical protein